MSTCIVGDWDEFWLFCTLLLLSIVHIIIATGLPAPLNDVPQGRHFFIRRYFMNEVKPHLSYEGQIDKPDLSNSFLNIIRKIINKFISPCFVFVNDRSNIMIEEYQIRIRMNRCTVLCISDDVPAGPMWDATSQMPYRKEKPEQLALWSETAKANCQNWKK